MLTFHTLTIDDRAWLQPLLWRCGRPGAEYTFQNMFFWDRYYGKMTQIDGFAVQACEDNGILRCCYPIGDGDAIPVVEKLAAYCGEKGLRLQLRGITAVMQAELEAALPGKFEFTLFRDAYDYIYNIEDLCQLHGKKLQAKRNHCNRFIAEHPDWYTAPITAQTLPLCRELAEQWYAEHPENGKISAEKRALSRAFAHYEALNFDGLILFDGQRVVAFSMGARMNERYFDVNFEKAFAQIQGSYAMINREFSRMVAEKYPQVRFLNREDDMGEPGLRKAKESYQPTVMLEKSMANWREG